ncbi:hypothetical protein GCM10010245_58150 [Streptomyces spectabilis]|nr:hypothetical protein GCM10010245_58150 [Streptomyces spectabilis]
MSPRVWNAPTPEAARPAFAVATLCFRGASESAARAGTAAPTASSVAKAAEAAPVRIRTWSSPKEPFGRGTFDATLVRAAV